MHHPMHVLDAPGCYAHTMVLGKIHDMGLHQQWRSQGVGVKPPPVGSSEIFMYIVKNK